MAAKDPGPLSWNVPIVDVRSGRPSPEFQRRWETQRANFALIGSITLGHGVPTGKPEDGAEYVNIDTTPFTVYVGSGGAWHQAGVVVFTDLSDAPHAYTGAGLHLIRIKNSENGVEFASVSTILDGLGSPAEGDILFRGATDWALLSPGVADEVLTTRGPGADPVWQGLAGFTFAYNGPVPANTLIGVCSWTKTMTFHNSDTRNWGTALVRPTSDYRFPILNSSSSQVGYIDVTTAGVWSVVWNTDSFVVSAGTLLQIWTQAVADNSLAAISARVVGYF